MGRRLSDCSHVTSRFAWEIGGSQGDVEGIWKDELGDVDAKGDDVTVVNDWDTLDVFQDRGYADRRWSPPSQESRGPKAGVLVEILAPNPTADVSAGETTDGTREKAGVESEGWGPLWGLVLRCRVDGARTGSVGRAISWGGVERVRGTAKRSY